LFFVRGSLAVDRIVDRDFWQAGGPGLAACPGSPARVIRLERRRID
jgi:hypothetical protein